MKQFGLIGYPLGHSFSRAFFSEKFEREGIEAEYLNFAIPEIGELPEIIQTHKELAGLNVTIPYKLQVIPYLTELSPAARAIGAVNVIKILHNGDETRLIGHNADVIGFCDSLKPLLKAQHTRALVLGTGGASRAVDYGLRSLGIEPTFVSRTPREGQLGYADLTAEVIDSHKLIVNTTPLGMYPKTDACPDLPYPLLTPDHLLYDLVYNPEETLFLRKGREAGAVTKNGLEMLHRQALASWNIWNEG